MCITQQHAFFNSSSNDSLDFDQVTKVRLFKRIYEFWLSLYSVLK